LFFMDRGKRDNYSWVVWPNCVANYSPYMYRQTTFLQQPPKSNGSQSMHPFLIPTIPSCDNVGLEESIALVHNTWQAHAGEVCGLWGFSQGARLAHLLAIYHTFHNCLPVLSFVAMVSGYEAPLPNELLKLCPEAATMASAVMSTVSTTDPPVSISIPSLHVWGETDRIIHPSQSNAVLPYYHHPHVYIHTGGHHVSMRAADVQTYLAMVNSSCTSLSRLHPTGGVERTRHALVCLCRP
jgi:hypothetical protein